MDDKLLKLDDRQLKIVKGLIDPTKGFTDREVEALALAIVYGQRIPTIGPVITALLWDESGDIGLPDCP